MLSIIILVFNQHDMTYECIQAIRETTQDCEIIIIDNGSDPAFKPPFTGFIDFVVIRNEENKGFPAAVNQGIRAAKGDVIVLLNNDVIVTPGWAEKFISALSAERVEVIEFGRPPYTVPAGQNFSIVGPVTNYCAGMQHVQVSSYHNKEELNQAAFEWAESIGNEIQEVNFVIGFCMAFKKALFDEIGEFDESMWPCSGEEVDFCFRAREAGHRVGIVTGVYLHHEGSRTFQDMEKAGQINYQEICRKCDEHLAKKWGADFWQRQAVTEAKQTVQVAPGEAIRLNLGSGYTPQEGYVNIDNREEVKPDLVCDVLDGLPYPDSSVDEVRAFDFLEHIPIGQTIQVITEIWRVLKPGGRFESLTPSTDGRGAFQDPTHVSFWNKNSWLYYSEPEYRDLYGIEANFKIEAITDLEIVKGIGVIHTHVVARAVEGETA